MEVDRQVSGQVGRWVGWFFWVRSFLLITLIKCLKGHKSLGLLFNVKIKRSLSHSLSAMSELQGLWTAKKVVFLSIPHQVFCKSDSKFNVYWMKTQNCHTVSAFQERHEERTFSHLKFSFLQNTSKYFSHQIRSNQFYPSLKQIAVKES